MSDLAQLDKLAKLYYKNLDLQNALVCYAEAFARYPYLGLAYSNYGKILAEMGHPEIAIPFVEQAIKLNPEDVNAPMNLAYAVLLKGDLKRGLNDFECRWKFKNHEHVLTMYTNPRYEGQDLTNKTLLVTCEEGDGDNLQFIRYVKKLNCKVIIQTEPQLKRLFTSSFKECIVIDNKEPIPEYDYWIPILSLPRVLNVTYENFESITNYLIPSKQSVTKWKKILKPLKKKTVAICYRGRTRNYSFEAILNFIKAHPEYDFISLQGIYENQEVEELEKLNVKIFFDEIDDWDDTAGLLKHIDYVISIDTGLAHLAGSLSVPTYILLDKYTSCWRWLLNKENTVWYPSVTLVRQLTVHGYDEQLGILAKKIGT